MDKKEALKKIIDLVGGQVKLAEKIGIKQQAVHSWIASGKIPAERVPVLAELSEGKVSRHDLRPDLW